MSASTRGAIETLAAELPDGLDALVAGVKRAAIVPALNEAGSIASVIAEIRAVDPGMEVVVVDDGSRDGTADIARRAGATVLGLPYNLGIGGAVQTGYRYALENGFDVAVQIDGDGQHDPGELEKLLRPLLADEADMVVGTRFRGERTYRPPLARRIGIMLFARLVSLIVRQRVTDATSGFRAVNRTGIRLFADDYPNDYPEVETTVLVFRHRLRMLEVPVLMRERSTGRSSITLFRSVYYVVKVSLALFIGLFRKPATLPEDT
jgi:glycosyltransferase involved in cell wall biosynthesis